VGVASRVVVDVLGSRLVSGAARSVTAGRLRILAYHGVPEPLAFRRQMQHLVEAYRPVSGAQATQWLHGDPSVPDRAVWVTFDDGQRDVVVHGLPVLGEYGIPATMFVTAGLVDSDEPFWWNVVEAAAAAGLVHGPQLLANLKACPDDERRELVAALRTRLADESGKRIRGDNLSRQDIRRWLEDGHEIGNHSWDHPCLNRCSEKEQVRQVSLAHDRLTGLTGMPPVLFAYPNGNWSPTVDAALRRLQYTIGLLFDHRLAARRGAPLRLSRLRVDSTADLPRFRSIVSGGHAGLFATWAAVTRRGRESHLPVPCL
jgi:peptidoglycan/xylan/chitin deacetylase (PgdA/CDA1 family)